MFTGNVSKIIFSTFFLSLPVHAQTNAIAVGQDTTRNGNLPPLLAVSHNKGSSWKVVTTLPDLKNTSLAGASCSKGGSKAVCVTGVNNNTELNPLVLVSQDGGDSWVLKSFTDGGMQAQFMSTSCTGKAAMAFCVAAGQSFGDPLPLVMQTVDGGTSWTLATVTGNPTASAYNSAFCYGGAGGKCVVAGWDLTSKHQALISSSIDGGQTWKVRPIAGLADGQSVLNSVSCSRNTCVAGGQILQGDRPPLLIVSHDGSITWSVATASDMPVSGNIKGVSCIGMICVAAGVQDATTMPILLVSVDSGNTWNAKSVINLKQGDFESVSCTSATCVAVGYNNDTNLPLVAVSVDGATTWNLKNVPNDNQQAIFHSVSCVGAVCSAAGQVLQAYGSPLLAVTNDGENTWEIKTISNMPANGYFSSTAIR